MNKHQKTLLVALPLVAAMSLAGCKNMSADDLTSLGMKSLQAATLSDNDVKALSQQSCAEMDAQSKIAPAKSAYTKRLNKIAKTLGNNLNGTPINYKVYITKDVNAWAMANGCVRVYSGLMDMMTDNEIQGVLGHELGHVALGHSKKAIQVAYATEIARDAAAASGNAKIASLSKSSLGALASAVINSQFSQKQEQDADNYSFDFLVKKKINPVGLATAFDKLGGGDASILSSHPSSTDRANNIRKKIAELKK
ncbi:MULTISPECIES: M48 family metallopeptidase [unclassified Gilliamella]|uniref:metalloprotease LoiP n=1 Tax=unclassified Gilliamella TaxID=2685620 RepID=UPI0004616CCF|nr:M48 family metallopeptidase [Gilliamella apicola]KDN09775.1 putative heat shock protein YcaL [Gilliamella apicola]OCG54829.1 metalloprotease [Gilliamella apicola]OCG61083.1 metalloprotease [Gilliamella apicola]OCG79054.1 metalloprotease [Gilliamella apicola]